MRLNKQYSWNTWRGAWNIVVASAITCQLLRVADISVDCGPAVLAAGSSFHTAVEQEPLGGVSWRSQREAPRTQFTLALVRFSTSPALPSFCSVNGPLTKANRDGVIWGEEEPSCKEAGCVLSAKRVPDPLPCPAPPKQLL